MDYKRRLELYEAAKRELVKRNPSDAEYQKEVKKLCRKYRI